MATPRPLWPVLLLAALNGCDVMGLPQSAASGVGRNHRIRDRETLYSIAAREYGDPLMWTVLQEANPWLDPERLQPGDIIYVPPRQGRNIYNVDPGALDVEPPPSEDPATAVADGGGSASWLRGSANGISSLFHNIGGRTIFGESVQKVGAAAFGGFLAHSLLQGLLLWIVATFTFVKDVSLKKAIKTSFHTGLVTLFTVFVLGAVGLLMVHIGTTAPGAGGDGDLLRTVEGYLRQPASTVVGAFSVFGLYLLLCTRFIPPALGLKRAQTMAILLLAIIVPHVLVLYTVSQRLGVVRL